jgi:hypothetical protein
MRHFIIVGFRILCRLCTVVVPALAAAQAAPDTGKACFTARPLPECRIFWLTEVGYYKRAFGAGVFPASPLPGENRRDLASHGSWEVGLMSNRSPRTAVGGTVLVGIGGSTLRLGLKGRYRRWIPERKFVEVSAGALRVATSTPYSQGRSTGFGITGDVSVGWRDWIAATARADAVHGSGHTAGAVFGGVRLGSYPAIVATAAVAAFIGLLLALLSGEGT